MQGGFGVRKVHVGELTHALMPALLLLFPQHPKYPLHPPRPAGTHPTSASPRCCSFPLISRSSRLAPRASRRTKHQKPGLVVQEGNLLTWGLSHDPAAPSQHPRSRQHRVPKGGRSQTPPCPGRAPKILLPCRPLSSCFQKQNAFFFF